MVDDVTLPVLAICCIQFHFHHGSRVAGTGVLGGIMHMYDRQTTSRCPLQGCFL